MNTYLKLAIGVAAVAVIAVVGANLFISDQQVGGPAPVASPSTSPRPTPSPSPAVFPSQGPLAAGTYPAVLGGVPISFAVASGWRSEDGVLVRGAEGRYGQPDSAAIRFWVSTPDNVYADPCAHTPLSPLPAATPAGLAEAVAKMPGIDVVTQPTPVAIDGRPGQYVAIKIREDITCDPEDFYLWYEDRPLGDNWVWGGERGSLHRVWIVDVDGKPVWIDSESFKGATPALDQEIEQIVESTRFQ